MIFTADTRAGLVTLIGASTVLTPLVLGLSAAAMAVGLVTGALAIALGMAGTAPEGRGVLPLSTLASYDQGLALGLVFCAVLFIIAAQAPAVALFATAALLQAVVSLSTRYSSSRRVSQNFLQ